jgi:hypothetical protein
MVMIELIKQILIKWGCMHKWHPYHRTKIYDWKRNDEIPNKIEETWVCTKCGKIKKIEL